MAKRRKFTPEFKAEVVSDTLSTNYPHNVTQTSLSVSQTTSWDLNYFVSPLFPILEVFAIANASQLQHRTTAYPLLEEVGKL